jgi:DNA/RNA-binding domain of Phe-tRNA-synthetase-like protein
MQFGIKFSHLFNRSLHNIPHHSNIPRLPHTIDSRNSLALNHRVPLWFQDINAICHSQIEPADFSLSYSLFRKSVILTPQRLFP